MRRVETIFLTDEELNAFKMVQKILDDLDFASWTTDAKFVQEVAAGIEDIDVDDDGNYRARSFQIKHQEY